MPEPGRLKSDVNRLQKSWWREREHDTSLLCNRSSSFVTVRRVQQTSKTIPNLSGNSAIVVLADSSHISTFVEYLRCCSGDVENSGPPAKAKPDEKENGDTS